MARLIGCVLKMLATVVTCAWVGFMLMLLGRAPTAGSMGDDIMDFIWEK